MGEGLGGYQLGTVGGRTEKLSPSYTGESSEAKWESVDFILQMSLAKEANQQCRRMVSTDVLQSGQSSNPNSKTLVTLQSRL